MSDFVDRVTVHVKKYKPLAGPNGGNGGDGGSVIFVASRNATSLLDYRFMPHRVAPGGTMGLGDNKDGSKGDDLILPVPCGTVIFTARGPQGQPKHPGGCRRRRRPGQYRTGQPHPSCPGLRPAWRAW